jgi:hypothetical protein
VSLIVKQINKGFKVEVVVEEQVKRTATYIFDCQGVSKQEAREMAEIQVQRDSTLIPADVKENTISVTRILSCNVARVAE